MVAAQLIKASSVPGPVVQIVSGFEALYWSSPACSGVHGTASGSGSLTRSMTARKPNAGNVHSSPDNSKVSATSSGLTA